MQAKCDTNDIAVAGSDLSISLSQMMGAFWSLAFAAAVPVFAMATEFVWAKLHKLLPSLHKGTVAPTPNDGRIPTDEKSNERNEQLQVSYNFPNASDGIWQEASEVAEQRRHQLREDLPGIDRDWKSAKENGHDVAAIARKEEAI